MLGKENVTFLKLLFMASAVDKEWIFILHKTREVHDTDNTDNDTEIIAGHYAVSISTALGLLVLNMKSSSYSFKNSQDLCSSKNKL